VYIVLLPSVSAFHCKSLNIALSFRSSKSIIIIMSPEDKSSSQNPGTLLVFSKKPMEEARIFGLRGSDIISVEAPLEEDPPVSPEDWGITGNNEEGVCKYCQLMLHPNAPKVVRHQPNLESLITSTCQFCGWVEVSVAQGMPELAMRYSKGDPRLHDPNDTSSVVTLELSKKPMYTRLVASVGPRRPFMDRGLPMISVRVAQLG
jgi:hypothetical protein